MRLLRPFTLFVVAAIAVAVAAIVAVLGPIVKDQLPQSITDRALEIVVGAVAIAAVSAGIGTVLNRTRHVATEEPSPSGESPERTPPPPSPPSPPSPPTPPTPTPPLAHRPLPLAPRPDLYHTYALQEHFTGRIAERQMLTAWFTDGTFPVLTLTAIGGMGKSALAWAWLHRDVLDLPLPGQQPETADADDGLRVPEDQRPEGVLWWSFYEHDSSFPAFLDRALAYCGRGEVDPTTIPSAYDKVAVLLDLLQERRFLLVLDGFERELRAYAGMDAAYLGDLIAQDARDDYRACVDPNAAELLRGIASRALRSRVLLTSRLFPRELDGLAGSRYEDLHSMDPDDAVAFFQAHGVRGNRNEIQAACAPYGYLPLALRLLAGYIAAPGPGTGDIKLLERYPVPEGDLKARQAHILQVSYDALDPDDRELLSRVAAFRSPMTLDAIAAVSALRRMGRRGPRRALTEGELVPVLAALVARGLLQFDSATARYDLHPVVRRYAYDRLTDPEGVHSRLVDYFAAVPAPQDPQSVTSVDDLSQVIELYHHTVRAGGYDDARALYRDRLQERLYFRLAAYREQIELLTALFPDGEGRPPRLRDESAQAWTLNALASSYGLSGLPRRALPLFEATNALVEKADNERPLATGLSNLALIQFVLGDLAAAAANLRRAIDISSEIADENQEAIGRAQLGWLLAYQGRWADADRELEAALVGFTQQNDTQGQGVVWAFRALRALLTGERNAALDAARRAFALAEERERTRRRNELDFIRVDWIIGAALVALVEAEPGSAEGHLADAEGPLTRAISRSRSINLVEMEPDILLALARWHRAKGNRLEALRQAEEALAIADRSEYRLKQADIHNLLARLALDAGDRDTARREAETAKERATCDGPPHYYKPAYEEAERLVAEATA